MSTVEQIRKDENGIIYRIWYTREIASWKSKLNVSKNKITNMRVKIEMFFNFFTELRPTKHSQKDDSWSFQEPREYGSP